MNLSAGPINLLLTTFDSPAGPWLLVGTVTGPTLALAAAELAARAEQSR